MPSVSTENSHKMESTSRRVHAAMAQQPRQLQPRQQQPDILELQQQAWMQRLWNESQQALPTQAQAYTQMPTNTPLSPQTWLDQSDFQTIRRAPTQAQAQETRHDQLTAQQTIQPRRQAQGNQNRTQVGHQWQQELQEQRLQLLQQRARQQQMSNTQQRSQLQPSPVLSLDASPVQQLVSTPPYNLTDQPQVRGQSQQQPSPSHNDSTSPSILYGATSVRPDQEQRAFLGGEVEDEYSQATIRPSQAAQFQQALEQQNERPQKRARHTRNQSMMSTVSTASYASHASALSVATAASSASIANLDLKSAKQPTSITAEQINQYIEETAGPENKKWLCTYPQCSHAAFGRRENAKSHVQTHLDDRQYKCPQCKAGFVRQHDLVRHAKNHTGQKPYECECGTSFTRHDALTRHKQRGMCQGAFPNIQRPPPKPRGRPRKNPIPDDVEGRRDRKTQARARAAASHGGHSRNTSIATLSDWSGASSPPSDVDMLLSPGPSYRFQRTTTTTNTTITDLGELDNMAPMPTTTAPMSMMTATMPTTMTEPMATIRASPMTATTSTASNTMTALEEAFMTPAAMPTTTLSPEQLTTYGAFGTPMLSSPAPNQASSSAATSPQTPMLSDFGQMEDFSANYGVHYTDVDIWLTGAIMPQVNMGGKMDEDLIDDQFASWTQGGDFDGGLM